MMQTEQPASETEPAIMPVLPTCCFLCNSSKVEVDVNRCLLDTNGESLADVVVSAVPQCRDELQLISSICLGCLVALTEYHRLRRQTAQLASRLRLGYTQSQLARNAKEVVIQLGSNLVSLPYGVYRLHWSGLSQPNVKTRTGELELLGRVTPGDVGESEGPEVGQTELLAEETSPPDCPAVVDNAEACQEQTDKCLDVEIRLEPAGESTAEAAHNDDEAAVSGNSQPFPCPLCPRSLSSAVQARCHVLVHHRQQLRACGPLPDYLAIYPCPHCTAIFSSKARRARHENTHTPAASRHSGVPDDKAALKGYVVKRRGESKDSPVCDDDGADPGLERRRLDQTNRDSRQCSPRTSPGTGRRVRFTYTCDVCQKQFAKRSEMLRHREAHEDSSYTCITCEKHFRTLLGYRKHERVHRGAGRVCPHCSRVFDTDPNLRTHLQTHTQLRRHLCHLCGAKFKFVQTLSRHRATKHGGDTPPYVCEVCGRGFHLAHSLKLHASRHGPRTLLCPHCPRLLANRPDLRRHVLRAHPALADPLQTALRAIGHQ